jgi:RHS repeat-associated protein
MLRILPLAHPFGMNQEGAWGVPPHANRYQYNGKELNTDFGLNLNDYGARWYDSAIARWTSVDPLAGKHPSWTPFNYCMQNPVRLIDPDGRDTTLYAQGSGEKLATKLSGSRKTPIWTVDTQAKNYDANNPWATASPLNYEVGASSEHGGLTGQSFRGDHPLCGIGACAGTQVYEEDLLDLTTEFINVVTLGLPEFTGLQYKLFPDVRFRNLVTDGAKFDLKSMITTDGTPSYSAAVIGEWSFFNGKLRRYDDYGNISFGAFGLEAGYHKSTLLFGSNGNQLFKDWFGNTSGSGDEPRDVQMMKLGFKLYEQGYFNGK